MIAITTSSSIRVNPRPGPDGRCRVANGVSFSKCTHRPRRTPRRNGPRRGLGYERDEGERSRIKTGARGEETVPVATRRPVEKNGPFQPNTDQPARCEANEG